MAVLIHRKLKSHTQRINLQWLSAIALSTFPLLLATVSTEAVYAQSVDPTPVISPSPIPLPTPSDVVDPTPTPSPSPEPSPSPSPTLPPEPPQPVSLNVLNPSFEEDAVGGDQGNYSIIGWQLLGAPYSAGVYYPASGPYSQIVPDGFKIAYANTGGVIFQQLSDFLTSNTTYTLGVDVGSRPPYGFTGYTIDLLAGDSVLASVSDPAPSYGEYVYSELTYTASEQDPFLGQPLGIRLSSKGVQINFDNVRLTALALPVAEPEPAAEPEPDNDPVTPEDNTTDGSLAPSVVTENPSAPDETTPGPDNTLIAADSEFRELPASSEPILEFRAAAVVADSVSVPEPGSVLGLLVLGALGVRSLFKRSH